MDCTYVTVSGDTKKCINKGCGRIMHSQFPPEKCHSLCRSPKAQAEREVARRQKVIAADMPSIARRIVNYGLHKTIQYAHGNPKRSEKEVLNILTHYCQLCQLFDGEHCTHKKCGCDMQLAIADATKHCPLDPPKW